MRGTVSFWWLSQTLRYVLLLVLLLSTVVYVITMNTSLSNSYLHPINSTKSINATSYEWYQKGPATKITDNNIKVETVESYSRDSFNKYANQTTTEQINNYTKQIFVNETYVSKDFNYTFLYFKTKGVFNNTKERTKKMPNLKPKAPLPLCSEVPWGLGPIRVDKRNVLIDEVEKRFPEVRHGGQYAPPNCTARHRIAIIVPYRDRDQHLSIFLNHMHPFLMKQQLEYGIFIVEQYRYKYFNKAKLMNVGFVESQKERAGGWQCFLFHDVDLLPQDQRNLYYCPKHPLHLSVLIDKYNYQVEYVFGGVIAMTVEQFTKVNGFSNRYKGWGGEDDDMRERVQEIYRGFARYVNLPITKYIMLKHEPSPRNPFRFELLSRAAQSMKEDGLSTLQYKMISRMKHRLYTKYIVNVD